MNSRLADVLLVPWLRSAYILHLEAELGMENIYFIDAVQVGRTHTKHTHTHTQKHTQHTQTHTMCV
jgi:hypothetical protein